MQRITEVVSTLRSDYVVIEPTTIDEARLESLGTDAVTTHLNPRWPFGQEARELLYSPPPALPGTISSLACPIGWEPDRR